MTNKKAEVTKQPEGELSIEMLESVSGGAQKASHGTSTKSHSPTQAQIDAAAEACEETGRC